MDESRMTLGKDWSGQDVTGWMASEKFDGCRAYWDGCEMWTRSGALVEVPEWFRAHLPLGIEVDGEIWAGYGRFTEAVNAVRHGRFTADTRFIAHDMPSALGAWEQRMRSVPVGGVLHRVKFQPVESVRQMLHLYEAVRARGGEGLILNSPAASAYIEGKTSLRLKLKAHNARQLRAAA